ncbi:MAG: hypothetical protein H0T73_04925 [Ardenticatenales bacterium]|nr:hypothetical protein [Ardenticatenales bacterium]
MNSYSSLWDVVAPTAIFALLGLGVTALCFSSLLVVLIEAAVLWKMGWGTFRRSFLDSLGMNVLSVLLGAVILIPLAPLFLLIIAFALSVLIEGGVLTMLKRHPVRETWTGALAANAASYAAWLLLFLLLLSPQGLLTPP